MALPPAALPRLGSLLRLLGSDQDGEALGAARAIGRVLAGFGLTLHDLAAAVERPCEPAVVFRDPPAPRKRKAARKPRPDDVVLDAAACRGVGNALWRAMAGGRLSEWEAGFADSLAEQMRAGRCHITKKQADALGRILDKLGEAVPWA